MKFISLLSNLKLLYNFFLFLALINIFFSTGKSHAKTFSINDIEISTPFEINFNKNEIIDEGFVKAFNELILSIVQSKDQVKLKNTSINQIKGMIETFSIKEEKFIDEIYYLALNVSFNKKNIFDLLESKNIFPSLPVKKDFLFIPVIVDQNKNQVLMFSENKLFSNWNLNNKNKIKKNNLIVAIPSSGLHSNGYSLVRYLLKQKKINIKKNKFLKYELLKPTKIYVKEIMKLINSNLINGCANITGGGLSDNIKRIIPDKLSAHISLNKIKTSKIFNWLKNNGISDKEMLKTFNCGVGFCLIVESKNLKKISKFFSKEYKPYVIGKILDNKNKVNLNGSINWHR